MERRIYLKKLLVCAMAGTLLLDGCTGQYHTEQVREESKKVGELDSLADEEGKTEPGNRNVEQGPEQGNRDVEQGTEQGNRNVEQGTGQGNRNVEQGPGQGHRDVEQGTGQGNRDVEQGTGLEAGSFAEETTAVPEIVEADWSDYFDGLYGAAVIYDTLHQRFTVYHRELAETRRSPCSTFKIISSLTALENGIIEPAHSTRKWSGEVFWNEKWNCDIDFADAFRASCVWYFREVIDEIGQERMQEELDRLCYGNCDISDWEGRGNTNNNNRALTGFWIESSLKISAKEQTEVLARIFGGDSVYSEDSRNELKSVMKIEEQAHADFTIYGKTGMGKANGILEDAWFAGFAENAGGNIYFCVYLGRTDDQNVSSAVAKEIAIRLVSDYNQTLTL